MRDDEYLIERCRFKFQRQPYHLSRKLYRRKVLWHVFAFLSAFLPAALAILFALTNNDLMVYGGGFVGIVLMILASEPIMEAKKWE